MEPVLYIAVAGAIAAFAFGLPLGLFAAATVGLCSD